MIRLFLLFFISAAGCSPVLDAQLRLIDESRKGVTQVSQSIAERQRVIAALEASRRARLDAAFDRDVDDQMNITPAWVIEARKAYAAAIEQLTRAEQAGRAAAEVDRANLTAVDAALEQLESLTRAQLRLAQLPEKRP